MSEGVTRNHGFPRRSAEIKRVWISSGTIKIAWTMGREVARFCLLERNDEGLREGREKLGETEDTHNRDLRQGLLLANKRVYRQGYHSVPNT